MKQIKNWILGGLLAVMLTATVFAADLQKGLDAYDAGDYATAFTELTPFAEEGDAEAQNILGWMYENGRGVARDYVEAIKWYLLAADSELADAQNNLGRMYENGWGVAQDYEKAVRRYRRAAETRDATAQNNLGRMYENGWGVAQDDILAYTWYSLAADQENKTSEKNSNKVARRMTREQRAEAQNNLGRMYENGEGGAPQDYGKAERWYRLAAEAGNAIAQNNLGRMYENGWGVAQDDILAYTWYSLAADQENKTAEKNRNKLAHRMTQKQRAEAQNNLGRMYENGEGGAPQDYGKAERWYRLAAETGNAIAQNNLGRMYENGWGVAQDDILAYMWYSFAVDQGNEVAGKNRKKLAYHMIQKQLVKAQFKVGWMYENSRGAPRNYKEAWNHKKAMEWYSLLAKAGYAAAQNNLGWMYDKGKGDIQDYGEAVKWYRLAAEAGYASAQNNLGFMHYNGLGVSQDISRDKRRILGYAWYSLAADQGNETAEENREIAARRMTPEQIAEAKKMAEEMAQKITKNQKKSR